MAIETLTPSPLPAAAAATLAAALGTAAFTTHALGGVQSLNNEVRLLQLADGTRLALRLASPRAARHLGVDWTEEAAIARAAGEAGLGPRLVFAEAATGLMLSEWIGSGAHARREQLREPGPLRIVAELAARLNALPPPAGVRRSIFDRIAALEASLERLGAAGVPDRHRYRLAALAAEDVARPGLMHDDLWANNLLDDGERFWLTDWEFSGSGDRLYDLASIAITAELDAPGERELLAIAGRAVGDLDRLRAMRWVVRYFEGCWGLVMARLAARASDASGDSFDFAAHGRRMLELLDAA